MPPAASAQAAGSPDHGTGTPPPDAGRTAPGGQPMPDAASAEGSVREALRALWRAVRRDGSRNVQASWAWVAGRAGKGLARAGATVRNRAPEWSALRLRWPSKGRAGVRGGGAAGRGWRLAVWSMAALAAGAAATGLALWLTMRDLPLAEVLPPLPEPTMTVELANGEVLTAQGAYRAPYVALDEMPPHLGQAVLAIEDRRFRDHRGIDLRGTARALLRNVRAGGVVQGGSTITQQLVKILYLTPERSLRRKVQEAVLAAMLERQLGKDRILELYLNAVYLGSGAHGVPAAARTYFDKDVGALSLPEAALLAASVQLPSVVNPLSDPAAARSRGALVLGLMADQGRIDTATRDRALAELATLAPKPPPTRAGSYFADWVLAEMNTIKGPSSEGLSATATLNPGLQARAERIVQEVMATQGAAAGATQAALVVMTADGRVRAMVGGLDYKASQFNRATDARRQPGSTFKLFVYLAALALGANPETRVSDAPVVMGNWNPQNFDRKSHGTVTLRQAFAMSYNLAAVRLAQTIGVQRVIEMARRLGIEADLQATPSLALGTSEVTLLDMTEAFAGVARGRVPVQATGIETLRLAETGGALRVVKVAEREQTNLTQTQKPMLDLLRAVVETGTGRGAAIRGRDILGKTGTSQDSRDAWFIGFVRGTGLVVGVWVGNDDNTPMDRVTGGGLPAEIFRRTVVAALQGAAAPAAANPPAPAGAAKARQCNVRACSAAYRSFRAADCTFQPYSGRRRLCTR